MRGKILNIVLIILAFFLGVSGTILVYKLVPSEKVVVNKTENSVNVTETNSLKASIDKVYDAVFLIEAQTRSGKSTGSGFAYKKDGKTGYIITNAHVVNNATSVKVVNSKGETFDAKILGMDVYADVAVLSTDAKNITLVASIGDSSKIELGDTIFTVGAPLGSKYFGTITKGIIAGKNRLVGSASIMLEAIQIDAAINNGNSGGPLVNINGEVIGVNSMKIASDVIEGMGFAIPINTVMSYVERLEKGEKIDRPVFGVSIADINNTWQLYMYGIILDQSVEYGAVLVNVEADYPAAKAGLQKGDVILEIDGAKIEDSSYFRYALYKYKVGDTITVKYFRNNKIYETKVVLNKKAEA